MHWLSPGNEALQVFDPEGEMVREITSVAGNNMAQFEFTGSPAGYFYVVLKTKNGTNSVRVLKL